MQQAFKPYTNLVLAIIEKLLLQHRLELLFEVMRGTWTWWSLFPVLRHEIMNASANY